MEMISIGLLKAIAGGIVGLVVGKMTCVLFIGQDWD